MTTDAETHQEPSILDKVTKDLKIKIEYWRQKLLDLTRRNRLIAFKDYKTSTLLFQPFEPLKNITALINVKEIFVYKFLDDEEDDENQQSETDKTEMPEVDLNVIFQSLDDNIWLPGTRDKETERRLYNLYLRSNESIREQGINTLFVAYGFLKYFDAKASDEEVKAPLFMIPVTINKLRRVYKHKHSYSLVTLDDGIQLNPAIVQKMLIEFNLELPQFEPGEASMEQAMTEWLEGLSKLIEGKPRWSVLHDFCLGIFTFEKIQMYHDIDIHRQNILDHPLLQVLAGASPSLVGDFEGVPDESEIDDYIQIQDVNSVLDADSSQQVAISAANKGISYVIQGPPGTGKSQTIVNIIAELIAQDKRVLFVSAKMAALDVVKKRLDDVGLGDYCLELHSHKANKKHILDQLEKQLMNRRMIDSQVNGSDFSAKYTFSRSELNNYGEELLKPRGELGYSLYETISNYVNLHKISTIPLDVDNSLQISPNEHNSIIRTLKNLELYPDEMTHYQNHIWKGTTLTEYNIAEIQELNSIVQQLLTSDKHLQEFIERIHNSTKLFPQTLADLNIIYTLFEKIVNKPNSFPLEKNWFTTQIDHDSQVVGRITDITNRNQEINSYISQHYKSDFYSLDFAKEIQEIESEYSGITRLAKPNFWKKKKYLQHFAQDKMSFKTIKDDLQLLKELSENNQELERLQTEISDFLNNVDQIENFDWNVFKQILTWVAEVKSYNLDLSPELIELIVNNNQLINQLLGKFNQLFKLSYETLLNKLVETYFNTNNTPSLRGYPDQVSIEGISNWISNLHGNFSLLNKWIEFNNHLETLDENLLEFTQHFLASDSQPTELVEAYNKAFLQKYISEIQRDMKLMSGEYFNQIINDFCQLDQAVSDVSKMKIVQKLESKKPSTNTFNHTSSSEIAILKREIQKERRHKPLRKLLTEIPNLVTTLKPCFMMSPLSVAHYINLEKMKQFDYVIFDEASQIMPEDAICSLIRAKHAIVVGDTQQLPPTRFFSSLDDDFEIDEDLEDLNSLLNETASKLGQKYLKWHYRSKDEALIAFSNRNYYKNSLITFPNSQFDSSDKGIEFVHVKNGIYDRGGARKNAVEAKKVVELIKAHFDHHPTKSLGVVAFSMQQQRAILEQLEVFMKRNSKYADFIESNDNILDEFFVKNLENVQGDERDVMIFSIGYGPDQNGKMTLNFGPINRDGGYKRLNVAITRAKEKVYLVSSFDPESIDRTTISNQGVQQLINYMRYAKNGIKEIAGDVQVSDVIDLDSSFEEDVYERLTSRGWDLATQVGTSGYRVDLAVKHPKKKGIFLLGIECDGKAYHSSKTARDRDRIRQAVLENYGWNIHRIWSTDWLLNSDEEIIKIENKLEFLINNKKDQADTKNQKNSGIGLEEVVVDNNASIPLKEYKRIVLDNKRGGIEAFNNSYYYSLDDQIKKVVSQEYPIHIDLLLSRIAESWGFARIGNNIRKKVLSRLNYSPNKHIVERNKILWDGKAKELVPARLSEKEDRPFQLIPLEELGWLAVELLKNGFSVSKDDLMFEITKHYNYSRRGRIVQNHLDKTIQYLQSIGKVEIKDDRIQLTKS